VPGSKSTGKLAKKESASELVTKTAFSEGMGGAVARAFGVPNKRRQNFQIAYTLWPLNRAKECIDMAYHLAGSAGDIRPWLERYERLARMVLPKWAKKKSQRYLRETYDILDRGLDPEPVLYEFKGFAYGVFCRALMESHDKARADDTVDKITCLTSGGRQHYRHV